eukprot:552160-Pleurochrysis_carterae.AAC.1
MFPSMRKVVNLQLASLPLARRDRLRRAGFVDLALGSPSDSLADLSSRARPNLALVRLFASSAHRVGHLFLEGQRKLVVALLVKSIKLYLGVLGSPWHLHLLFLMKLRSTRGSAAPRATRPSALRESSPPAVRSTDSQYHAQGC